MPNLWQNNIQLINQVPDWISAEEARFGGTLPVGGPPHGSGESGVGTDSVRHATVILGGGGGGSKGEVEYARGVCGMQG